MGGAEHIHIPAPVSILAHFTKTVQFQTAGGSEAVPWGGGGVGFWMLLYHVGGSHVASAGERLGTPPGAGMPPVLSQPRVPVSTKAIWSTKAPYWPVENILPPCSEIGRKHAKAEARKCFL